MVLHIDTKDQKVVKVALEKEGKVVGTLSEENEFGSQALLPLISKLLKEHKLSLKDLTGIKVEAGPGSYTGLRVGVAVANALGFALGVPVNNKKVETEIGYE